MDTGNFAVRHMQHDEWESVLRLTNTVWSDMPADLFCFMFTKDEDAISLIAVDESGIGVE